MYLLDMLMEKVTSGGVLFNSQRRETIISQ